MVAPATAATIDDCTLTGRDLAADAFMAVKGGADRATVAQEHAEAFAAGASDETRVTLAAFIDVLLQLAE